MASKRAFAVYQSNMFDDKIEQSFVNSGLRISQISLLHKVSRAEFLEKHSADESAIAAAHESVIRHAKSMYFRSPIQSDLHRLEVITGIASV